MLRLKPELPAFPPRALPQAAPCSREPALPTLSPHWTGWPPLQPPPCCSRFLGAAQTPPPLSSPRPVYPHGLAKAQGGPFENALLPFTALPSAREAWVWEAVPARRGLQEEGAGGLASPPQPLQPPARLLGGEGGLRAGGRQGV